MTFNVYEKKICHCKYCIKYKIINIYFIAFILKLMIHRNKKISLLVEIIVEYNFEVNNSQKCVLKIEHRF